MSLILYGLTALALLWMVRRWLMPLSAAAALALMLIPFCFTGRALLTGAVYGPIDLIFEGQPMDSIRSTYDVTPTHNGMLSDLYTQMFPYRQALREHIARGEWPLWDPYVLCGQPLAAIAQPAAYSPFTLIALLLPVALSFTFTASIAFFIAALSLFLFARELGCRESASLFGAAGWAFASAISFFILWPLAMTWVLLPFVLFATRRIVRDPSARSAALLTVALTLLILAGHPESVLHVLSVGVVYGVYEIARVKNRAGVIGLALVSGAITLLLCAIYLLPFADAVPQTGQYVARKMIESQPIVDTPAMEMFVRFSTDFFITAETRTWKTFEAGSVSPGTVGVGSVILAAAIYALWRSRRAEKWFFGGLLLFCILAHLQWPPLQHILLRLPLFKITINDRYAFAAACILAILGAIGIEELCARNDRQAFAATSTIVLVVITFGSLALESHHLTINAFPWGDFRLFADVALLAVASLMIALRMPLRIAAPALVALVLLQRTMQESAVYPTLPARSAYPSNPYLEPLRDIREPFRIIGHGMASVPETNAFYGVEDARGYSAMTLREMFMTYPLWCIHQPVFINRVDDLTRPFLSFLNIRFAIAGTYTPTPNGWHDVYSYRHAHLMENEHVIDRAFVPHFIRIGYSEAQSLNQMMKETDFRERAWIAAKMSPHEDANGTGDVDIARTKYGFMIDATMQNDGWIVVSEPSWKGWRAYIDGRRIQHQIANVAFLGIYVPKGTHKVRLIYMPRSFVIGRTITFVTMAALLLWFSLSRAKRGISGAFARTLAMPLSQSGITVILSRRSAAKDP